MLFARKLHRPTSHPPGPPQETIPKIWWGESAGTMIWLRQEMGMCGSGSDGLASGVLIYLISVLPAPSPTLFFSVLLYSVLPLDSYNVGHANWCVSVDKYSDRNSESYCSASQLISWAFSYFLFFFFFYTFLVMHDRRVHSFLQNSNRREIKG